MTHEEYYRLASSVLEQADEMQGLWKKLERRLMPRMVDGATGGKNEACSVASESMHTLAAAMHTYITPNGMQWFKFRSADKLEDERYNKWYENATEVALQELAKSNFYAEVQEAYLSRVLYGTALMLCETKRGGGLIFKNIPVGSFGVAENDEGVIDTVCRKFRFSAAQAVERWGKKVPNKVLEAYNRPGERFEKEKFTFLHLVTPRREYTKGNGGGAGKNPDGTWAQGFVPAKKRTYASIYIFEGEDRPVVEEGGYEEFPFLATRFLKKPGWVFGYPPALMCWSSIVSLMKLENNLDLLGDLTVFPRLLTLADEVGEIDFRAGGQTVISDLAASTNMPREWGTQGRMSECKERIEQKKQEIKSAFYIPYLHSITDVDRTMTATEVQARQEERVLSISPTFALLTSDLNPLLYRVFSVLFRQGAFNAPQYMQPVKLRVSAKDGTEDYSVSVPQVHYMGRISQAIEKSQRLGVEGAMQTIGEYVHLTGDTAALDFFDTGKMLTRSVESLGVPPGSIRSEDEVKAIRTQRQQMQMAQAQAEMAAQQAGAAKDLAGAA